MKALYGLAATIALLGYVAAATAIALIDFDAWLTLWRRGDEGLAVLAFVAFPFTVFIWPFAEDDAQVFGIACWLLLIVGGIAIVVQFAAAALAELVADAY